MPTPLSDSELRATQSTLPEWSVGADALERTYEFANFRAAISFIVRIAFYADRLEHHPELTNVYNRVTIRLTTHDAGDKVTEKDLELAKIIEDVAWV